MKPTRHIEYTPRESRLLQEAIRAYIYALEVHNVGDKDEIADLKKLKERIRLGPRGALQEARLFLKTFSRAMPPTRRSMEQLSVLKIKVERIERRHREAQTVVREANILLNQLSPPHP